MHRSYQRLRSWGIAAALLTLLVFPFSSYAQTATPDSSAAVDTTASRVNAADLVNREFGATGPQIDMTRVNMDHGVPLSKNPTLAFTLSLAVPGAGQLYTKNYFKAIAFFGTDVGMILGLLQQNRLYHSNHDTVQRLISEGYPEEVYSDYVRLADFYQNDRNRLIWWTAGVTLLSALDAYVEAHLFDFHIDPTLEAAPQGDGMKMGISFNF